MGAKEKNFYNQVFRRWYEREADAIQSLYLEGRKDAAEAAIPADYLARVAHRHPTFVRTGCRLSRPRDDAQRLIPRGVARGAVRQ